MKAIPVLLDRRSRVTAADIDLRVVTGNWKKLVLHSGGTVNKNAYVFCVLTGFHRHLKRRGIYTPNSTRWTDPRAELLNGDRWEAARADVMTTLGLPEDPTVLLGEHRRTLDATYRRTAARLNETDSDVTIGADGRLHIAAITAIDDPDSLVALRRSIAGLLPRVELTEIVLEVMGWEPRFVEAFRSLSGGSGRLEGLDVSIAAVLTAQAMNIGYRPIVNKGSPALRRDRLSHVAQTYFTAENLAAANAPLIERQADIGLLARLAAGLSPRSTA